MLNFYPGPSKLYPQTNEWLAEIYDSGILSKNHRSEAFMELWQATETLLQATLNIPPNYEIYVTSSATECWEIVNQSLVRGNVHYLFNGAFGEKWFTYATKSQAFSKNNSFTINEVPFGLHEFATDFMPVQSDTICLTHNETSNGTYVSDQAMQTIRTNFSDALIAVDATSSMAGVELPWNTADVWFASVQKCFGSPAGLAVMVVSPGAIARAKEVNENAHYNSFLNIRANFLKDQTPYTPNILGIALLNKSTAFRPNIAEISKKISRRADALYTFFQESSSLKLLVDSPELRSKTVLTVETADVRKIITSLKEKSITVGKGYGKWKETTFRIANFPAIEDAEFERLKEALATL